MHKYAVYGNEKETPFQVARRLELKLDECILCGGITKTKMTMKLKIEWKWYDLWIGFYWDRKKKTLFFCPFPTIVFSFQFLFYSRGKKDAQGCALVNPELKVIGPEN